MSENPFERETVGQAALQDALHRAVDAARASMRESGYDVEAATLAATVRWDDDRLRTAAAFPMNDYKGHADLMREGAIVFDMASGAQEPLYAAVQRELQGRGWKLVPTVGDGPLAPLYEDPEGNKYADIGDAIHAQSMREIGMAARAAAHDVLGDEWDPETRTWRDAP